MISATARVTDLGRRRRGSWQTVLGRFRVEAPCPFDAHCFGEFRPLPACCSIVAAESEARGGRASNFRRKALPKPVESAILTSGCGRGDPPSAGSGAWRSLASASEWGSEGRWFKSSRPDYSSNRALRRKRRRAFSLLGKDLRRLKYGSNKRNPGSRVGWSRLNRAKRPQSVGSSRRGPGPFPLGLVPHPPTGAKVEQKTGAKTSREEQKEQERKRREKGDILLFIL